MVDFVKKRLQVFVSSTYEDLKVERQSAVEAILTAGHIPAGMELFTAGDESQMEVIKQWIDESDVYLLILGGRYGSIEPKSGKSYTHLEYEYAVEREKPLFSCVITPESIERRVKEKGTSVIETAEPKGLSEFREIVLSKMSKLWDDSKDIKIAVGEAMSYFARRDGMQGWVRPSKEVDVGAIVSELARLSSENANLHKMAALGQPGLLVSGLNYLEMKELLEKKKLLAEFRRLKRSSGQGGMFRSRVVSEVAANEFEHLGLIVVGISTQELTDAGRAFMARLELEDVRAGKN